MFKARREARDAAKAILDAFSADRPREVAFVVLGSQIYDYEEGGTWAVAVYPTQEEAGAEATRLQEALRIAKSAALEAAADSTLLDPSLIYVAAGKFVQDAMEAAGDPMFKSLGADSVSYFVQEVRIGGAADGL